MIPAIVDQHIHLGMGHDQPVGDIDDALRIAHVEFVDIHSGTGGGGFPQRREAPPRDDDLVAEGMKSLGQPLPDA